MKPEERYNLDWMDEHLLVAQAWDIFKQHAGWRTAHPLWPDAVRLELEKRGLLTPDLLARFAALKLELL